MSKKLLVVAMTVLGLLLGGCASSGYGNGSGNDPHAGHSH
jgi:major membrane immunogen (membrane-anchored lipoprotein)